MLILAKSKIVLTWYFFNIYPINNFTIIKHTAPGNPSNPMIMLLTIFNPIWNPKLAPIKLITYITIPPNIEFIISFNIFFNGTIKILPIINIKQIQAKYVIIFKSISAIIPFGRHILVGKELNFGKENFI